MKLYTASSRRAKKWQPCEMSFEELAGKIRHPKITSERFQDYLAMNREDQDELKDVGGFVLGELKNGIRSNATVISRSGIALDLDSIGSPENLNLIRERLYSLECIFCLYSTRKSKKNTPRVRILIPLSRSVDAEEYEYISRILCQTLGMDFCDRTTVQPARMMYWPSISSDMESEYIYEYRAGDETYKTLNPDSLLNAVPNWRDRTTWPVFSQEGPKAAESADQLTDPREKNGVIGLFCRSYTIPEAIAEFLPNVYTATDDPRRYSYAEGSSSKGAVLYGREEFGEDVFLYSFHATDPYGGKTHNAYDLVRLYKFGDSGRAEKKMRDLVFSDKKTQAKAAQEKAEEIEEFTRTVRDEEENGEKDWKEIYQDIFSRLEKDERNRSKAASTRDNVLTILHKDPSFSDSYYYDSFADRVIVSKKMPWTRDARSYAQEWKDSDDAALRWYLEKFYKIKGEKIILDALEMTFQERAVHPVKDYLESLEWDGTPRLETLLVDYFGAEDNVYTRDVMRKSLVGAVARIYEPGAKFDAMPILVGEQGTGKSTFIRVLGKDWYSDSLTDFDGKDSYELLQNNWLIEIPELNGFTKYEMNQIKHFLTKQVDEYRSPYKRRKESHPRQCILFGTTNEQTFLRDTTGNRRFWPVQLGINKPTKNVFEDLENEVDQIWAEAYFDYTVVGEDLFLEGESKKISEVEQALRLEEDPSRELIIEFLKREIPLDWKKWEIDRRLSYWDFPDNYNCKTRRRTEVCPNEIIRELFREQIIPGDRRRSKAIRQILNTIPGVTPEVKTARYGCSYETAKGYTIDPEKLDALT